MSWLLAADTAVFRFVNQKLNHPFLDSVMPILAGGAWFISLAILGAVLLFWKGGLRARLFLVVLGLVLAFGDTFVILPIKRAISRPRPSQAVADVILSPRVGKGKAQSMPSSHASTWAAAALIAFAYYPRSRNVLVPIGLLICFSRVYLGAHYPSDVLAGVILGGGYAAAGLWALQTLWRWAGPKWFRPWYDQVPSLLLRANPPRGSPKTLGSEPAETAGRARRDNAFLSFGYVLVAVVLLARLAYVASARIELSADEAYQWLLSKHLALSYFSDPPGIAYLLAVSNRFWGDTQFGVRFFPPVIAAALGVMTLKFFARTVNPRAAFFLVLMMNVTPLLAGGAILMTGDAPLVLFWAAAMMAGWWAVQPGATVWSWLWVGLWAGLAVLFRYSALLLVPCWALFFLLWPPARAHLKHPGPWLALLILLVSTLPVVVWNWQHDWIAFLSAASKARLETAGPTLRHFLEFTVGEAGLLNPIFFVAAVWALCLAWKRWQAHPLWIYFFALSAPVFFGCWLCALRSPAPLHWIAPAVIPLFCLTVAFWHQRWREGARFVKPWLNAGLILGGAVTILSHDTNLVFRSTGRWLPAQVDPLRRVRAIQASVAEIEKARDELSREGRETFIIGGDYGITSQVTFYLPEARVGLRDLPLAYPLEFAEPRSQFFFWPEYRYTQKRKGQSAILVLLDERGKAPPEIVRQFESVTDLGLRSIQYRRRTFHTMRLLACRNLL